MSFGWIFGLLVVLVVGAVFLGFWLLERGDAREEARWRDRERRTCRETSDFFAREHERETAFRATLRGLSWPELRRRCAAATGVECQCATRYAVGTRLWRAQLRAEQVEKGAA